MRLKKVGVFRRAAAPGSPIERAPKYERSIRVRSSGFTRKEEELLQLAEGFCTKRSRLAGGRLGASKVRSAGAVGRRSAPG